MIDSLKRLTIILPRIIDRLDGLRDAIADFLAAHAVSDGNVTRVEMSVYEAVVNIIEHGDSSSGSEGNDIWVECQVDWNEVVVTMKYYGRPFDITKVEMPDLEKHYRSGKMRGLGIYFIMTLMDRVEYSHENMMSTLRMVKKVR